MENTLISFETAKIAKEKGFNEPCDSWFFENADGLHNNASEWVNSMLAIDDYSAPTQSLLQKWLREKHSIIVLVGLKESSLSLYTPTIQYIASKTTSLIAHFPTHFKTYEEALELGLIEGLKRIKQYGRN